MRALLSCVIGGAVGLAVLYLGYLGGMALQFELMVHAQPQEPRVVTLAIGRFGATDQELQECYFNIGQGAMLALNPSGEPCVLARELIGRTGTLLFVPD